MGTTLVMVMFGIMMVGVIAAGLVALHYLLKKKEQQAIMATIKAEIIPQIESMTKNVLESSMDMVMNKSVEITKKLMETSYD